MAKEWAVAVFFGLYSSFWLAQAIRWRRRAMELQDRLDMIRVATRAAERGEATARVVERVRSLAGRSL